MSVSRKAEECFQFISQQFKVNLLFWEAATEDAVSGIRTPGAAPK